MTSVASSTTVSVPLTRTRRRVANSTTTSPACCPAGSPHSGSPSGRPAAATADVAAAVDQVKATAAELPAPRLALRDGRLGLGVAGGPSRVTVGLAQV